MVPQGLQKPFQNFSTRSSLKCPMEGLLKVLFKVLFKQNFSQWSYSRTLCSGPCRTTKQTHIEYGDRGFFPKTSAYKTKSLKGVFSLLCLLKTFYLWKNPQSLSRKEGLLNAYNLFKVNFLKMISSFMKEGPLKIDRRSLQGLLSLFMSFNFKKRHTQSFPLTYRRPFGYIFPIQVPLEALCLQNYY